MEKVEIIRILGEIKGKSNSDIVKLRIDDICEIIDDLPEETVTKHNSLTEFTEKYLIGNESRLDNIENDVVNIYGDLKAKKIKKDKIKSEAISVMRKVKKSRAIIVIVVLSIIMGGVIVLGILSSLGQIDSVWCSLIGVLDTAFGILFFIYEYCDDKLQESKINDGDYDTVSKYQIKRTGDIKNSAVGSANNTGINYGTIIGTSNTLENLFKKN